MTHRNFGIASGRQRLGGASTPPAASIGRYAPSNSNSSDREFGAFCFALFGLTCPFAIVGVAITVYLLLFS